LLEEVAYDSHVYGLDSCPQRAGNRIVLSHERREQERLSLALEEELSRHPDTGLGGEEGEVGIAAADLPAKHETFRPRATEAQADRRPPG
jgi:hypothetical protein